MELKHILFVPSVHIYFHKHTSLGNVKFVVNDFYEIITDAYDGIWIPGHFLRIPALLCNKHRWDVEEIIERNVRSFVQVFVGKKPVDFYIYSVEMDALNWIYDSQTDTDEPYGNYFSVELVEQRETGKD